jgi:membrane-associated phospholipid phosphatase
MPASLWTRSNAVDRLYFAWFPALSLLILVAHQRIPNWPAHLFLNGGLLVAILFLRWARDRSRVARFLHDWYPLLLFIVSFEEVAFLSRHMLPGWRDDVLLRLEGKLFPVPATVWFGQYASWWTTEILEIGYFSYYLLLLIVGGVLYRRSDKRPFRNVMTASVLSYLLCYVIFIVFPTEGPAHTLAALHDRPLPGGPFHSLVTFMQRHAGVHGNAFPSSHVAAAVVTLVFGWRYAARLGATLTPFVALLCVASVYDRYHYLSDVIGGVVVGVLAVGIVWKFSTESTR